MKTQQVDMMDYNNEIRAGMVGMRIVSQTWLPCGTVQETPRRIQ